MRRGFNTLAAQAEKGLELDPYSGHLFVFRGRRGDLLKIIWWDAQGACLFSKRLEKGRFVWPAAKDGKIRVTPAQLSMLLEGIDLDRSTMADWIGRSTALLEPLADEIGRMVRRGEALFADDTSVKMQAPGQKKTKTARV